MCCTGNVVVQRSARGIHLPCDAFLTLQLADSHEVRRSGRELNLSHSSSFVAQNNVSGKNPENGFDYRIRGAVD
jgi:hypothetical protein